MFVACPNCSFLVAAPKGASLRCPRCGSAIDPKLAKPLAKPEAQVSATVPPADAAVAPMATADDEDNSATPTPPAEVAPPRRKRSSHAPSFARRHAPAPVRTTHWRSWLVVAALAVVLFAQILLAQREELAANARWRPLISGVCGVLRCQVPAWREPAAFTMLQRSVQPKPGARGVLHVSASFRNDARWEQPWPTVLLTLSDMDGRQVGLRAFTPADYLGKRDQGHIAPGQSATIELDVIEPPRQVVAFTFDFM
jgi:hypothetical protein